MELVGGFISQHPCKGWIDPDEPARHGHLKHALHGVLIHSPVAHFRHQELLLQCHLFAQIGDKRNMPKRAPIGVPQDVAVDQNRHPPAVIAHEDAFQFSVFLVDKGPPVCLEEFSIAGRGKIEDMPAEQLLPRVTDHLAVGFIGVKDPEVFIHHEESLARSLHNPPILSLRSPQNLLFLLQLQVGCIHFLDYVAIKSRAQFLDILQLFAIALGARQ